MRAEVCQRWNGGRDSYRPAGEVIAAREYEVSPLDRDSTAKAFVLLHHYSASYPAARFPLRAEKGGADRRRRRLLAAVQLNTLPYPKKEAP